MLVAFFIWVSFHLQYMFLHQLGRNLTPVLLSGLDGDGVFLSQRGRRIINQKNLDPREQSIIYKSTLKINKKAAHVIFVCICRLAPEGPSLFICISFFASRLHISRQMHLLRKFSACFFKRFYLARGRKVVKSMWRWCVRPGSFFSRAQNDAVYPARIIFPLNISINVCRKSRPAGAAESSPRNYIMRRNHHHRVGGPPLALIQMSQSK